MVVWRLKNCPRCGGDTFIDCDVDGWCEKCLQCGNRRGCISPWVDLPGASRTKPVLQESGIEEQAR